MRKKTNLLITGPLGHIGSKFIHNLSEKDEIGSVTMIDNFFTLRYPSLFNLPEKVKFRFIEGDILSFDFDSILQDIDVVIHLAAITDAANSFEFQDKVYNVNLEGTKRVSEACARNSVKMIFISTTSVYGTQNEVVDENCTEEELMPQSPYAKSKLLAENALSTLAKKDSAFRYVICRFGTIYGASIGMRFHTAINKFIWQSVMNEPISVWKTALHQRRPYLLLDDAIRALHFIIKNGLFTNDVYNVLSVNLTVNDIINEIKKHIPDVRINFVDSKIMNQLSYTVSNKKFTSLGFEFNGSMEEISKSIKLLENSNNINKK